MNDNGSGQHAGDMPPKRRQCPMGVRGEDRVPTGETSQQKNTGGPRKSGTSPFLWIGKKAREECGEQQRHGHGGQVWWLARVRGGRPKLADFKIRTQTATPQLPLYADSTESFIGFRACCVELPSQTRREA